MSTFRKSAGLLLAALFLFAGNVSAGEKTIMHCFAFTPVEEATGEQWNAFFRATDELPSKIDGFERVWYGELRRPLNQFLRRRKQEDGKEVTYYEQVQRKWGVCMEFANLEALEKYGAPENEAHNAWEEVYFKVRQPGTTTYDIIGR